MSYFNQHKYSSSSATEETASVEKGHRNTMKVDINKFEDLCKKFREKKDLKIVNLTGTDKEDFELIVSYVSLLYNTKYYSTLFEKVKKHFQKVTSVQPGTVGAYFAGCLVNKSNETLSSGCSLGCVGSMPPPKEEGWDFCDKAVLVAEKKGEGYDFSVMKPANSESEMDPAYLFVESKSLDDFRGFSKEEKDKIRAYGCKKVKLVGYSKDMTYSDLYKDPKHVHEIKHRRNYRTSSEESDSNAGIVIFAIALLVLLFLILCFLCYKYYSM